MEKTARGGIGLLVLRVLVGPIGRGAMVAACIGLMGLVVHAWGLIPLALALGSLVFWLLGWGAARRYWRKNGYVPKI